MMMTFITRGRRPRGGNRRATKSKGRGLEERLVARSVSVKKFLAYSSLPVKLMKVLYWDKTMLPIL